MAKVSLSIPDDVVTAAKAAGLNMSRLATLALTAQLDQRAKVAELDAYLASLEAELGPIGDEDAKNAAAWADRLDAASGAADEERRRSA